MVYKINEGINQSPHLFYRILANSEAGFHCG